MNTKSFYVYGHIRTDKMEVFYVGLGSKNRAWSKHHRNAHWHNVYNKCNGDLRLAMFGENLTFEEAVALEIENIKYWGRKDLNEGTLVNKTDGGEGTKNIVVTKEKAERCGKAISIVLKKKYETQPHPSLGRVESEQHIDYRISCIKKRTVALGRKESNNYGLNHKQCLGLVYQYCKETGKLLNTFESTGLAEKATGIHSGRITAVINKKRTQSKGFIFTRDEINTATDNRFSNQARLHL